MDAPTTKNNHIVHRRMPCNRPRSSNQRYGGFIGIIAAIVASIGAGYDDGATPYQ